MLFVVQPLFPWLRGSRKKVSNSVPGSSRLFAAPGQSVCHFLRKVVYARLGFSVAVHVEPDILLIDEVLAVGDEHFQQKCLHRMGELRRRGTIVILVFHSMPTIEQMCDRVCLLVRGRLEAEGNPEEVVARYREVRAGGHAPG
jgi:ABC-type polysaccharide/polyol phosphate transport system ATPase subunit